MKSDEMDLLAQRAAAAASNYILEVLNLKEGVPMPRQQASLLAAVYSGTIAYLLSNVHLNFPFFEKEPLNDHILKFADQLSDAYRESHKKATEAAKAPKIVSENDAVRE